MLQTVQRLCDVIDGQKRLLGGMEEVRGLVQGVLREVGLEGVGMGLGLGLGVGMGGMEGGMAEVKDEMSE